MGFLEDLANLLACKYNRKCHRFSPGPLLTLHCLKGIALCRHISPPTELPAQAALSLFHVYLHSSTDTATVK